MPDNDTTALQLRHGDTTESNSFAGLPAELSVDTERNVLFLHDGNAAPGHEQARASLANVKVLDGNSREVEDLDSLTDGNFFKLRWNKSAGRFEIVPFTLK